MKKIASATAAGEQEIQHAHAVRQQRHRHDAIGIQREEEQHRGEGQPRMVVLEDLVAEEDGEQHREERPRRGEHRAARIEHEKRAPQSAERKLRGEGQDGPPARPRFAVGHPLRQHMQNEHAERGQREIADEHQLRVRQIDPAEGVIVEGEAADHAGRRQRPLMPGDEGEGAFDHATMTPACWLMQYTARVLAVA